MESVVLNRDIFLQMREELSGKKEEYVEIAAGVKVRVVQLTSDAGFALIAMGQDDNDADDKPVDGKSFAKNSYRWLCACVLDENNDPVFEMDDFKTLPFELVQKIMRVVNRVNGLSGADGSEDAEKNSAKTLS